MKEGRSAGMKKWWIATVGFLKRHWKWALLVPLLIAGMVWATSCQPEPTPTPTPTVTPAPIVTPTPTPKPIFKYGRTCETKVTEEEVKELEPFSKKIPTRAPFLVPNQVIVTGPNSEDISKVVEVVENDLRKVFGVAEDDRLLVLLRTCTFDSKLTMNLYHIDTPPEWEVDSNHIQESPEEKAVKAINAEGRKQHVSVFADLNLLVGNSASASVCGNPDYSDGGSPFGAPTPLEKVVAEAAADFWDQWAFEQIGMDWSQPDMAASLPQGEDVIVGVFDTSPFSDPWDDGANGQEMPTEAEDIDSNSGAELLTIEITETIEWVNRTEVEPLQVVTKPLTVLYPLIDNSLDDETNASNIYDVRDHGLFVAGLVHATAPASELRLIKVLNEFGCGDLWTLNKALEYFVDEVVNQDRSKGVVINLSLGVYAPDENMSLGCEPLENTDIIPAQLESTDIITAVHSLCTVLSRADERGIVVVAAAGNDSGEELQPRPPQMPAAIDSVVSVQASNRYGDLACFSNKGEVTAPGGDGDRTNNVCGHKIEGCCDDGIPQGCDCSEDIISLVLTPGKENVDQPPYYGYWRGTSFAAPLVSGLAALTLQAGAVPDGEVTPQVSCSVADIIDRGASISGGIVNVPNTLADVCLP